MTTPQLSPATHERDRELLWRFVRYLTPHKWSLLAIFLVLLGTAAIQFAPALIVTGAIDTCIVHNDVSCLNRLSLLYVGIVVLTVAFEFAQSHLIQRVGQRVMSDIRVRVYAHLFHLDTAFHDRHTTGSLVGAVTHDVEALGELFNANILTVASGTFTFLGIVAVLIWIDWRLAALTLLTLQLVVLFVSRFRTFSRHSFRTIRTSYSNLVALLHEYISGTVTLQLHGAQGAAYNRLSTVNRVYRNAYVAQVQHHAIFLAGVEGVGTIAVGAVLFLGCVYVTNNTLTIGSLTAVLMYVVRLFKPVTDISDKFNVLQSVVAALERIFNTLDTPKSSASSAPDYAQGVNTAARTPLNDQQSCRPPHSAAPRSYSDLHVVFENVSFAYSTNQHSHDCVLRNVTFSIHRGERVGIVGHTGAGKSTLFNVLLRLYEVTSGRILLNGQDIRSLDLRELRAHMGLLPQNTPLLSRSIGDNIRIGNPSLTAAQLESLAVTAGARDFITAHAAAFETPINCDGSPLSAGERQLISLMRVLARNPEVILLDEPTSSLDLDREHHMANALKALMNGRTTIAIAHRLTTLQSMDKMIVLHRGQVQEIGTHRELLDRRGMYHKLFELQQRLPVWRPGA